MDILTLTAHFQVKEDQGLTYSHRSDLMVKKLRYYARFIVVCLLLKKIKIVRELVRELASLIDDYTSAYEPEDQLEWSLVLGEIRSFIEADNLVNIIDQVYTRLTSVWAVFSFFRLPSR